MVETSRSLAHLKDMSGECRREKDVIRSGENTKRKKREKYDLPKVSFR